MMILVETKIGLQVGFSGEFINSAWRNCHERCMDAAVRIWFEDIIFVTKFAHAEAQAENGWKCLQTWHCPMTINESHAKEK